MDKIRNIKRRKEILGDYLKENHSPDEMYYHLCRLFHYGFPRSSNSLNIFFYLVFDHRIPEILTAEEYFISLRYAYELFDIPKSLSEERNCEVLFRLNPNPKLMMTEDETKYFDDLPDKIKIYRGYREGRRKRLAWTLKKEVAEFFAYKFGKRLPLPGTVVSMVVNKNEAYGFLNGRNEYEIILPLESQKNFHYESKPPKDG